MATYQTPGVYVEHVITETERVLRTGVPVFLGLIDRQDLATYNAQQADVNEQYLEKPIPSFPDAFIARKRGYLKLPARPYASAAESWQSDSLVTDRTFHLRHVVGDQSSRRNAQVRTSWGTAGRPDGLAELDSVQLDSEAVQAISAKPQRFTVWPQFEATYGDLAPFGFLTYAVRGFFENQGNLCYVQLISFAGDSPLAAVYAGLKTLEASDDFDLICVPDLMWLALGKRGVDVATLYAMQLAVIHSCEQAGDCFALLDTPYGMTPEQVPAQLQGMTSENAALYYPWVQVLDGPAATAALVPPCGHVAGVINRTDLQIGVHKAPANAVLSGVVDLAVDLTNEQQGPLNEANVNCLRAFPKRGIRVWGARTLSQQPAWKYINVRRIFLTAARWIERNLTDVVFEPNTPELWGRIVRELTTYFTELVENGALASRNSAEAFYVKCDAETNPPELRDNGQVVTEIGLAPAASIEFIVVRIIHGPAGVHLLGPT